MHKRVALWLDSFEPPHQWIITHDHLNKDGLVMSSRVIGMFPRNQFEDAKIEAIRSLVHWDMPFLSQRTSIRAFSLGGLNTIFNHELVS